MNNIILGLQILQRQGTRDVQPIIAADGVITVYLNSSVENFFVVNNLTNLGWSAYNNGKNWFYVID